MAEVRQQTAAPPLATVVYRSRAVAPLPGAELQDLIQTSQSRNAGEAITGVVLYDESHFYQWLEGPPEGVERVMHSIHNDPRHTDLEILARRTAPVRMFSGWDMKLAAPGATSLASLQDVIEPPAEIIENLRRQPTAAPSLLVKLVAAPPDSPRAGGQTAASMARKALGQASASVLKAVIVQSVIPLLLHRHGLDAASEARSMLHPRAPELAELLIASDQVASLDLIRELRGDQGDPRHLFAPLFEPAARSLGDLWNHDICSEFDVKLGLCRLQTAVRLLGIDAPRATLRADHPNVLIAPAPGELHQLMAALDSEWLWGVGWAPQTEFPADDRALEELVSARWVDVLDLSLSAAFRREDSLPRLTTTIAQARRASRNPALVVLVGGRAFVEDVADGSDVGANFASKTSDHIDQRILSEIRNGEATSHRPARWDPRTPA